MTLQMLPRKNKGITVFFTRLLMGGREKSRIICRGQIVSWTLAASPLNGMVYLGSISAVCSDGNILAGVRLGFNNSGPSGVDKYESYDPSLITEATVRNPSSFNYRCRPGPYCLLLWCVIGSRMMLLAEDLSIASPTMPSWHFTCNFYLCISDFHVLLRDESCV